MPSWNETAREIRQRNGDFDGVRRERIRAVEEITGRPLVIYASAFLQQEKVAVASSGVSIDSQDKIGFDEVTSELQGPNLDVLLHSPGGSAEAADAIVALLRSRFTNIRFIVPDMAKSAATMICCSGDSILMDERSELGPIDPQMQLTRGDKTPVMAPAQAIIEQFELAKQSLAKNPEYVAAWLPLLQPLSPSLLTQCQMADNMAHTLVQTWLKSYMFAGLPDCEQRADKVAAYLRSSPTHLSHARRIGIDDLSAQGLVIEDLRKTPELRKAIWNLYLAIDATLSGTNAYKMIENAHGAALIRLLMVQQVQLVPSPSAPSAPVQGEPRHKRKSRPL